MRPLAAFLVLALGLCVFAIANGAMWLTAIETQDPVGRAWRVANGGMVGVNLGGWLLLEKWLVDRAQRSLQYGPIDSPFELPAAAGATDERSLSRRLRATGQLDALDTWRARYITQADFIAIRLAGLDAVRIPFGWWLAADADDPAPDEYHRGSGLQLLDSAMEWAQGAGLKVLLDLHGAPGSQNGRQTAGDETAGWTSASFDTNRTVAVLATVARRYCASGGALVGISLLNEPELQGQQLYDFYRRAYVAVRAAGCEPARVAVLVNLFALPAVLGDGWALNRQLPASRFPNLLFDVHLYYAFLPTWLQPLLSLRTLTTTAVGLQAMALYIAGRPSVVGEWSLELPFDGSLADELRRMPPARVANLTRAFGQEQLGAYSDQRGCVGTFYWTWNAPAHEASWSLQAMLQAGALNRSDFDKARRRKSDRFR